MEKVLIKLTLSPYRNYKESDIIDYEIINLAIVEILSSFLRLYSNEYVSFYDCGGGRYKLSRINMIIITDQNIIDGYQSLFDSKIIEHNSYIYNIIINKLMNIGNESEDFDIEPTEDEIVEKWNSIKLC